MNERTSMPSSPSLSPKVKAAAKLAALYALGVAVLAIPSSIPIARYVPVGLVSGTLAGLVLVVAFLLLATTRRAGFFVIWAALVAYWIRFLSMLSPLDLFQPFLLWSALAAPLFLFTTVGFPLPHAPRSRAVRLVSWSLAVPWALAFATGLWFRAQVRDWSPPTYLSSVAAIARFVYLPLPFLIAAYGLLHLTLATRSARAGTKATPNAA